MSPAPPTTGAPQPAPNGPRLDADRVVLPLVMIKGYPFIEGAIAGRAGKLMFDIGSASALVVDSHTVPLPDGVVTGNGFFGSGQTFQTLRFPRVDGLVLPGGLRFDGLTNIVGHPGLPIERDITPDFIGWIGVRFFDGHILKLDYRALTATLTRNDNAGVALRAALVDEAIVGSVPIGNPDHPNLPTYPIRIAGMAAVGGFDTGSPNVGWMSQERIAALKAAGALYAERDGRYTVNGLTIGGLTLPPMRFELHVGAPPFARLLPQPDALFLSLGTEFFSRYRTIWDFARKSVTFASY